MLGHYSSLSARACYDSLRVQGRAQRAARLAARNRERDPAGKASAHSRKRARRARRGTRRTTRRPLASVRKPMAAATEATTPSNSPHRLGVATPPRVRERGHPPGEVIVETEQDHRQGRL